MARTGEINDMGLGVVVHEDLDGYAVVMVDGKVKKRFTNSREDALGKADRLASDIFFERQRALPWR